MSIVERLREESEHDPDSYESMLFREAADEIERLQEKLKACVDITLRQGSEIERLRKDKLRELAESQAHEEKLREEFGKLLSDQGFEYNRKTNALIKRHSEQLAASQAREAKLRDALDLLWANADHSEWDAMAREHFERLIRGWK
jgi:hypothetical protein